MEDEKEFQAVYACKQYSGFTFRVGETTHKFVKHQLLIDDEEIAAELDAALKKYSSIGNKVKKVSLAAAEALVANHVATHGGAKSGPFNSQTSGQHEATQIAERDAALANMSNEDKQKLQEKLAADSDLILTERTDTETKATEVPTQIASLVENKPANPFANLNKTKVN